MPWNPVTVDDALAYLNELVKLDPRAMHSLVECRHLCNQSLADHPTAQVATSNGGIASVGLLGIINGMFGVDEDGWGPITANFDGDILVSFTKTAPRALLKKTK